MLEGSFEDDPSICIRSINGTWRAQFLQRGGESACVVSCSEEEIAFLNMDGNMPVSCRYLVYA